MRLGFLGAAGEVTGSCTVVAAIKARYDWPEVRVAVPGEFLSL
jgi:hypothetical protein